MDIVKTNDEEQICYSIVLEPELEDFQNDIVSGEEIQNAAHDFLAKYLYDGSAFMNLQHEKNIDSVKVVESFIVHVSFNWEGKSIKKGSWLMGIKVFDDKLWADIKSNKFSGFSIGGSGKRTIEED